MKVIQRLMWVSGGVVGRGGLLGLLGCDIFVQRSRHEPVYVAQPQPEYVIVREAPPAVIVERRPPPPNQGLVWIDGFWEWNGRQYVWEPGHWAAPPRGGVIWIAPRYERHEQGYRYMPGRWSEERREEEHRDRH
ncbi:MAG: YXWGXW repeat-containing protein [Planctomycetota bacterium]|nr:YXWGXW repeat-containing protein [Planctomycetota bacterium]